MSTVIAGISLVVGGVGIMNINVSFINRKNKRNWLAHFTWCNRNNPARFLFEAILISITGGLIGIIIGISSTKLVTLPMHYPTAVSQSSVILFFLVCFITGVFVCYYPALKASKLDPIEALKYE